MMSLCSVCLLPQSFKLHFLSQIRDLLEKNNNIQCCNFIVYLPTKTTKAP